MLNKHTFTIDSIFVSGAGERDGEDIGVGDEFGFRGWWDARSRFK